MPKYCLILIGFAYHLLFSIFAIGQTSPYSFKHISVSDGLSQSSVYTMFQDNEGFMWFGTEDGLNKFDGTKFITYKKEPLNRNSISHSWIWDIDQDDSGNIWVATWNGLNKINREKNLIIKYFPDEGNENSISNSRPDCLHYDRNGNLWIGTWGGGLNLYRKKSDDFKRYLPNESDANSISNHYVRTIYEDKEGTLWIGTWGGGINKYNPASNNFLRVATNTVEGTLHYGSEVTAISDGPGNQLCIGTYQNGISILDKSTYSFIELNDKTFRELKNKSITAVYKDNENQMWIGTQNDGLYIYDHGLFIHINQESHGNLGINGNYIYSLFQDKSGVVYVGNSGISMYHKSQTKFDHIEKAYPGKEGLSGNNVWCFAENSEGKLIIGMENDGLNIYDIHTNKIDKLNQLSFDSIIHSYPRTLEFDSFGNLWIGTIGEGVYQFPSGTNQILNLNNLYPDDEFHTQLRINALLADDSLLYIGTGADGVYLYDQKTQNISKLNTEYNDTVKISSDYVNTIIKDHNDNIWIGGWGGGIGFLKKGTRTLSRYFHDDANHQSLSNNIVNCLFEDKEGIIWIGTNQGLNKIIKPKGASFNSFDENIIKYFQKDGLANEVIYGIEGDDHGNLWISTNGGLSKFDPVHEIFTNFSPEDGLQDNEFNGKSSLKLSDGRLVFGGINGFNIFHPDSIKQDTLQPPVVLTGISIFGKEQNIDSLKSLKSTLKLPYAKNFISLEFAALDFAAPQKIQYAYKLVGVDEDFINAKNRRFINYTNLSPGNYQFILRNTNHDGIWNENQLFFDFEIMPPFWLTWWFGVLCAIVFSGIIYIIFQVRLSKILEIERIRTNIAGDLHDDIGSSLTKISLYSDLIKSGADSKKTNSYLRDISSLSREVIGSMSDIVWSIDLRHDSMQDLIDRMKEFAFSVCEPANISIQFHIEGIDVKRLVKPVFRQNIYLIYKEAINNILKHSHADKVTVDFIQKGFTLILKIADNGLGTSKAKYSLGGQGLVNMKNRAKRFGGNVEYLNKGGFRVILTCKFLKSSIL